VADRPARLAVAGYEHIRGRHAHRDLASPDVPVVVATIAELAGSHLTPSPTRVLPSLSYSMSATEPWRRLATASPRGMDAWTADHTPGLAGPRTGDGRHV
jgi:hypothetical protein